MRYDCSNVILVIINLLYFSWIGVEGKPVGHHEEDITSTIKTLRHDMHKVLHFIDHLSKDVIQNKETDIKGDKSRSVIPYQGQLNDLLADESVVKATANKAAKAVADSAKATLKTQKGVKKIAEGLIKLKNCLETFENTIKV